MLTQPIINIQTSLATLSDLLKRGVDDQDWRLTPEEWSFREIAAHMWTVEYDCHLVRVNELTANLQPEYSYYLNTGWDFSRYDLRASLEKWAQTRQQLIDQVQQLTPPQLAHTGQHITFGTLTIPDLLRLMHEHDQEHVRDLHPILEQYVQQK